MSAKVVNNILELVGETPVVKLNHMTAATDAGVYVKLESFNPAGSIKDRPGLYMIEKAEQEGKVGPGSVLIEATSGNTGIGLALAATVKRYPLIIVMPDNMSMERRKIIEAYGAQLVLTPAAEGMAGAVAEAGRLTESHSNYYWIRQFDNPANPECHAVSTAREILEQMGQRLDAIVCGVGSGGTITGLARVLKEQLPNIIIAAVEPAASAILSGGPVGAHKIQGIGAGFVPSVLNFKLIDRIFRIEDEEAIRTCKELARREGLLLGISSGAAVSAALQLAREKGEAGTILAIAPDGAEKYLSTELFD